MNMESVILLGCALAPISIIVFALTAGAEADEHLDHRQRESP